jgi:hypothetical protein
MLNACITQAQKAATPKEAVGLFYKSMAEVNAEKMHRVVTHDFLMIENSLLWNMDSVLKAMEPVKGTDFQIKESFRYINEGRQKQRATLVFWHEAEVFVRGKWQTVLYLESAELKKVAGSWKISLLHTTHVKPFQIP